MKNMLVTGGCGFIGSNFIRFLLEASDFSGKIINLDNLTYAGNIENLAGIEKKFPHRYVFIKADICNQDILADIFQTYMVDTICHFAAESHVDRSITAPDAFIRTNITGTFNLLEQARKNQTRMKLFHHVSTDEVYGSLGETGFFTEHTPYDPSSPYSASKAASDHLVKAYSRTYDLPVTLSNCSNNYGPYQFPEKLIPLVTFNALAGQALPVYGDGRNVRDWLYVMDHCRAIWAVMCHGTRGETYNIGGRCEKFNIDVVNIICDILDDITPDPGIGPRRRLITFVNDRPGHDLRYAIDCSKIEKELGWVPLESFSGGIKKTILWYLDNQAWAARIISGEYMTWAKEHYGQYVDNKK